MKITLTIPTSLSEITLEQNQRFSKLVEDKDPKKDVKLINDASIHCFCNLPLQAIGGLKVKDYNFAISQIKKVLEEKPDLQRTIKLDGVTYGFIPNLDKMTLGCYEDVNENFEEVRLWHRAMAGLYRKVTVKKGDLYRIEDYEGADKYCEQMKQLPMSVVVGCDVFFYNLRNDLLKTLKYYLKKSLSKKENKLLAQEKGIDMTYFIPLLEETILKLRLPQKSLLEAHLSF